MFQPGLGSTHRMNPTESNRANGSVLKQAMDASMSASFAPMIEERWQKTRARAGSRPRADGALLLH
jgi:hypothetical protein